MPTETSDTQPVESEPAVEESKKDAEEQPTDAYTQSNLSSSAPTEFKEPLMTTVPVRTTPEPINVHKEQSGAPSTPPTQRPVSSALQTLLLLTFAQADHPSHLVAMFTSRHIG